MKRNNESHAHISVSLWQWLRKEQLHSADSEQLVSLDKKIMHMDKLLVLCKNNAGREDVSAVGPFVQAA